jgi:hypothetical protein
MECHLRLDKYRIIVVALGVLVIIAFSVYTFGSYSNKPKAGTKVEPVKSVVTANTSRTDIANSDKNDFTEKAIGTPTKSSSLSSNQSSSSSSMPMSLFENHEKIENFYSIQFPSNSTVMHGNESGSYVAKFSKGIFSVDLIDIPDNSNVQLYALTQVKPALKSLPLLLKRLISA